MTMSKMFRQRTSDPGRRQSSFEAELLRPDRDAAMMRRVTPMRNLHALRVLVTTVAAVCLATSLQAQQPPSPKPDHMQHRFDDPERFAKSFDDPARDQWQMPDRVITALGLGRGNTVADIGAGTGYFSVRLARAVASGTVYAVDVEHAMLDYIRKRAAAERLSNVVPVHASSASPNLPKPVDLVLIVDTYHHLPDRASYFASLRKSLVPGGRVAIVDFRKSSPEGPPPEFRFEAEQIIDEMKEAGYTLDARHDFLPRQHFLIFR
jgi:ubiquinone/menaquinone biosynthesis C-methylase UbiE